MRKGLYKREKYGEKILHKLNLILRRDFNDTRLQFVSITRVELNRDYSVAKIYWDTFNMNKLPEVKEAMNKVAGRMRVLLSQVLDVHTIPATQLIYDNQFDEEQKVTQILDRERVEGKVPPPNASSGHHKE